MRSYLWVLIVFLAMTGAAAEKKSVMTTAYGVLTDPPNFASTNGLATVQQLNITSNALRGASAAVAPNTNTTAFTNVNGVVLISADVSKAEVAGKAGTNEVNALTTSVAGKAGTNETAALEASKAGTNDVAVLEASKAGTNDVAVLTAAVAGKAGTNDVAVLEASKAGTNDVAVLNAAIAGKAGTNDVIVSNSGTGTNTSFKGATTFQNDGGTPTVTVTSSNGVVAAAQFLGSGSGAGLLTLRDAGSNATILANGSNGVISASQFVGAGSGAGLLTLRDSSSNVTVSATGSNGVVSASQFRGIGSAAGAFYLLSSGGSNVTISATGSNGVITAAQFIGSGAGLTDIPGAEGSFSEAMLLTNATAGLWTNAAASNSVTTLSFLYAVYTASNTIASGRIDATIVRSNGVDTITATNALQDVILPSSGDLVSATALITNQTVGIWTNAADSNSVTTLSFLYAAKGTNTDISGRLDLTIVRSNGVDTITATNALQDVASAYASSWSSNAYNFVVYNLLYAAQLAGSGNGLTNIDPAGVNGLNAALTSSSNRLDALEASGANSTNSIDLSLLVTNETVYAWTNSAASNSATTLSIVWSAKAASESGGGRLEWTIVRSNGVDVVTGTNTFLPDGWATNANAFSVAGTLRANTISATNASLLGGSTATQIGLWGDSLTFGYAPTFAALTKYWTYNKGVGGETSTQIYNRFSDATNASILAGSISVICAGRNNYTVAATVLNDVSNMVSQLSAPRRFLILGVPNGEYETEYIGGEGYGQITNLNASLSATYSNKFLDIRTLLVNQYDATAEQDRIDWTNDIVPVSCRADAIHWSDKGKAIVSTNLLALIESVYGVQVPTASDIASMMTSPGLIGYSNPAPIKASAVTVTGNILPATNATSALGLTNAGWSSLFVDGSGRYTGAILSRLGFYPLDGGIASFIWQDAGDRLRVSGDTFEPTPGAATLLGDWNNRWSYVLGTNLSAVYGVVAGNVSIGQATSSVGVKNWGSVGIDNNGSVLLGANLYVNNSALAVANTHASFAGAGIYFPGITRMRSGGIDFYARTNRSVTANDAVTENPAMVLMPTGELGIGVTNPAAKLDVAGALAADSLRVTNTATVGTLEVTTIIGAAANSLVNSSTNQGALSFTLPDRGTKWQTLATNAAFALADPAGVSTYGTNVQQVVTVITNTSGSTITFTTPAAWLISGGSTQYLTNQGVLTVMVYPLLGTNAAWKCLK